MFVQWMMARVLALFGVSRASGHRDEAQPVPATHSDTDAGDAVLIEGVADHLLKTFDTQAIVFHEVVSTAVHIDIHIVPPGVDRPFYTLATSGMAEKAMPVPADAPNAARFAELVMMLPPDWRLEQEAFKDERWYWPVRRMKMLARAPHEMDTWFGPGHTVQMEEDLKPFAPNVGFCAFLLMPEPLGDGFSPLTLPDGRELAFLMAVPIYAEELEHARINGAESLAGLFEDHGVDLVIDPARPNVCTPPSP